MIVMNTAIHYYSKSSDLTWFRPVLAREVLQGDCLFSEEIESSLGVKYPDEEKERLFEGLPSRKTLEAYQQNNILLLAGPPEPLTLDQLQERHFIEGVNIPSDFLSEDSKVNPGWLAIRKGLLSGSVEKDWPQIQKNIPLGEKPANLAEITWCLTAYWRLRGVDLLSKALTYTEDLIEVGNLPTAHLVIGLSRQGCPVVSTWRDVGHPFWAVGLLTKIINPNFFLERRNYV